MPRSLPVLLLFVVTAACGGGSTNAILDACDERLNLDPELCRCVADRAETELSAEGRELLVAMLEGDSDRAEEIRRDGLDLAEITRVAGFVTSAPAQCANDAQETEG